MKNKSMFADLIAANNEKYIPNIAYRISSWAILEVSIKNNIQLCLITKLLENLLNYYSISWQPTIKNRDTYWIAFENENDLIAFRLSI